MAELPASSCQRGMGRHQASKSGMVALSTAFGRLATVGTDADPTPDRYSTYLGSGPNKQVLSIRIWPPDRHSLFEPGSNYKGAASEQSAGARLASYASPGETFELKAC
jgi:hypothetical protein